MASLSLEIDRASLTALFRKLGGAASAQVLRPPLERALKQVADDLAHYPAPTRKKQPAKSRRQQIKQVLLAKEGKIPYRRTQRLAKGWRQAPRVSAQGTNRSAARLEGTLRNTVAYGPLVQGDADTEQAAYHHGVWDTTFDVLSRRHAGILDDFHHAIDDALGR